MKAVNAELYLHDSDKAALAALKAIPGFSQVTKAFMKVWNEQMFHLINMSTNLRLSEEQMGKYHAMLEPICAKLGIEVPELYITLDEAPNAYTAGDTKPFIVLTSGLFKTMPDELIPTVIAHECGHIACHHTLYSTMGRILLTSASGMFGGISSAIMYPIQLAFAYWMRCSELSADRAAAICDGNGEKIAEMCMRFAGCDKRIHADATLEQFLKQAEDYRKLVKDSPVNKTMEFLLFQGQTHPMNAVRALEIMEWTDSDRFRTIQEYMQSDEGILARREPVLLDAGKVLNHNLMDVRVSLITKGFTHISAEPAECPADQKAGTIARITVDGRELTESDYVFPDAEVVLYYYEESSRIKMAEGVSSFKGKPYLKCAEELHHLGFNNISVQDVPMPIVVWDEKENTVARISIDGKDQFEPGSVFAKDAQVIISYYRY